MELVETVLVLEEKVKRLESQVKTLQTPTLTASTKPIVPPPDANAIEQRLRSEFVTQLNQLRTELAELKTHQPQHQPTSSSRETLKIRLHQLIIPVIMIVTGLGLWLMTWLSKPIETTTQVNPAISSPVVSLKAKPTTSHPLKKAKRRIAKPKPMQQPKLLDQARVNQAITELEADGYGSTGKEPH